MLKFRTPCVHRRRHGHPNWVGGVGALEGIPTLPSDSWDARGNALVTVFTSLGTKKRSEPDVYTQRSSEASLRLCRSTVAERAHEYNGEHTAERNGRAINDARHA